jgi:lysophospholipase L1-like esterase
MQKTEGTSLKKKLLLLLFTSLICFLIVEAAVRLVWTRPGYGYPDGLYLPDDTRLYKYAPLFNGTFEGSMYGNVTITTNSAGLRDQEHAYERSNDTLRIVALGDSVTFGSGVDYSQTYLSVLEAKMKSEGIGAEIIKAGIDGYQLDQEYDYYASEGYKYDPDIVMMGVVLNDVDESSSEIKDTLFGKHTNFNKFVADNFKSVDFFYHVLGDMFRGSNYNDYYFNVVYNHWGNDTKWGAYEETLVRLNENLTKGNKKLVLVIFPCTQQFKASLNTGRIPQDKIINLSLQNNMTVIDLLPYLNTPDYKNYYLVSDNVHLNKDGHALVANAIYDSLIEKNVISPPNNTFK